MKSKLVKRIIVGCLTLIIIFSITGGITVYQRYLKPTGYEALIRLPEHEEGKPFLPLEDSDRSVLGMVLVSENEFLKLYIDEVSTAIAVVDKASGVVTYSNPVNAMEDTIANPVNKSMMQSQIEIEYYNPTRNKKTMNNYADSIEASQFTFESLTDGIRIIYTLGNMTKGIESLPKYISEERLDEAVLSQLDEAQIKIVKKQYVPSATQKGFLELRAQVSNSKIVLGQMLEAFALAGYSDEDLLIDNADSGILVANEKAFFEIPLEYRLVDERLQANINMSLVKDSTEGKLSTIRLLRFFGAGSTEDQGYMLVPNGSGALIYFNNGKTNQDNFYAQIYDIDPVVASRLATQKIMPARMPIYGIKSNDQALFARISEGDALAAITSDISGKVNSYNHVGPVFTVRDYEQLSMFGSTGQAADLPVLEDHIYQGNLTIEYAFLTGEQANYSGMANYYRSYLQEQGVLVRNQEEKALPFYLDVLGAFEKKNFIMGVPYNTTYPMTTFEEASMMAEKLSEASVENIKLRYLGWFNDGYYHDVARDVKVIGKLGGEKGLKQLSESIAHLGGKLFPDVSFMKVSMTSKHYESSFESSRYIAGVTVISAPYNRSTMSMYSRFNEVVMQLVSPYALIRHIDGFVDSANKLELSSVSLRDMGDVIASDKRRKRPIDRQMAEDIVVAQVDKLNQNIESMMVVGGNEYTWQYATDIIDVPLGGSQYYMIDQTIPFMQMVLHGNVNYSAEAINVVGTTSMEETKLKLIEYASAPHFLLSYEDSAAVKKTALEDFYSTHFNVWFSDAVSVYTEVSEALNQIQGSQMIRHTELSNKVKKIEYDNGVTIFINYHRLAQEVEGIKISGMSYAIEGGDR